MTDNGPHDDDRTALVAWWERLREHDADYSRAGPLRCFGSLAALAAIGYATDDNDSSTVVDLLIVAAALWTIYLAVWWPPAVRPSRRQGQPPQ